MTGLRLRNTATRRVEPFEPIDPRDVRMYVCGPTVYDRAHLGNARPVVVFDVLFRLLRHLHGEDHVTYVRNVTDVDDKILARAAETGRPIGDITTETTRWFEEDMAALGALPPTHQPRATEWIPQMVAMIEGLVAKGHAYAAEGHVLFDVRSYPAYGALSGRSLDDMIAGARVEVAPYKRDPMDFVLWKPAAPGEQGWDSPRGRGRPGWHIECSAMSEALLGREFDIHGGGIDLQFPHHENEIAQSRCAHPEAAFARHWVHNEMLLVEGRKMSKSLGNFFTVRDLLDQGVPGEVIRLVLLGTHYGKPMDWTWEKADQAQRKLEKWRAMTSKSRPDDQPNKYFLDSLKDDLNTSLALSFLDKLADDGNGSSLLATAPMLGLLTPDQSAWFDFRTAKFDQNTDIEELLSYRQQLRSARRYAEADDLRNRMMALGIAVYDHPSGSRGFFQRGLLGRWRHSEAQRLHEERDRRIFAFIDESSDLGIYIEYGPEGWALII